jgi:hypothetical protein
MVATDLDSLDPALAYAAQSSVLLDTTCARLLVSSGHATPDGSGLVPEVAAGPPRRSRDGRTYTFTLRDEFRFSDGTPVRADAFARAIDRTLAPGVESPWAVYTREIVGAQDVTRGRASTTSGVVARGRSLVIRLRRPVPDFPAQTASFLCAVPPTLPPDREGYAEFAAAGPYYVAEYRPGEKVVLRRNRFYGGSRPHHVDGFDVDLRLGSPAEVLDRIERGDCERDVRGRRTPSRIDLRQVAILEVCHPDPASACGHRAGPVADWDRGGDRVRLGVDHADVVRRDLGEAARRIARREECDDGGGGESQSHGGERQRQPAAGGPRPERGARCTERLVVREDLVLELPEARAGFDPELRVEVVTRTLEDLERLRLAA